MAETTLSQSPQLSEDRDGDQDDAGEGGSGKGKKRDKIHRRSRWACDDCRGRKIKCDAKMPCMPCRLAHQECTYTFQRKSKYSGPLYVQELEEKVRTLESDNHSMASALQAVFPSIDLNSSNLEETIRRHIQLVWTPKTGQHSVSASPDIQRTATQITDPSPDTSEQQTDPKRRSRPNLSLSSLPSFTMQHQHYLQGRHNDSAIDLTTAASQPSIYATAPNPASFLQHSNSYPATYPPQFLQHQAQQQFMPQQQSHQNQHQQSHHQHQQPHLPQQQQQSQQPHHHQNMQAMIQPPQFVYQTYSSQSLQQVPLAASQFSGAETSESMTFSSPIENQYFPYFGSGWTGEDIDE